MAPEYRGKLAVMTPAASCRLVNTVLCSLTNLARPVGQADVGAVYAFSCAGLAANRALQLDEPTGGVNARKSVPS